MQIDEDKKEEFRKLSKDLIKFLCDNCHPHVSIIITPTSAELLEGEVGLYTEEFLRD